VNVKEKEAKKAPDDDQGESQWKRQRMRHRPPHGQLGRYFALHDPKAGEEVVLAWEWVDGNAVHSFPALLQTPGMFP